jgi:PTH1 family peptidyl-tRNA hydrolase
MRCIIGLGNPGLRYKYTRHNLGYLVIDKLCKKYQVKLKKRLCRSLIGSFHLGKNKLILVKPLTYMNLSGDAYICILSKYKLSTDNVLVICDDIYLNYGVVKIKPQGGSNGHKGLESILDKLGEDSFPRLRLGAGPFEGQNQSDFVLAKISKEERKDFDKIFENVVDAIEVWVKYGIEKAMSLYNNRNINF